jgi:hypothetical protein
MSASDVTISVLIVVTFFLLYMFNFFVVGFKRIKDNWPIYRCNPLVLPFASLFGFDAGQNFAFCIQNVQSAFMGEILKPVNYNIGVLNNVGGSLTGNVGGIRSMFDNIRKSIMAAIQSVFGVFLNMMIEMQRIMVNLKDLFGKLMGIMSTVMYTLSGSMMTMNSAWDGPGGDMVRFLCFHPDTLVEVAAPDLGGPEGPPLLVPMKDLKLNTVLKTGTRVCAVMHISNVDENGQPIEDMYTLPRDDGVPRDDIVVTGVPRDDIVVTGSHLVYDPSQRQFVPVHSLTLAKKAVGQPCDTLTCLITSDHTIPIGQWLFHDWEDNQGSPAKSVHSVNKPPLSSSQSVGQGGAHLISRLI